MKCKYLSHKVIIFKTIFLLFLMNAVIPSYGAEEIPGNEADINAVCEIIVLPVTPVSCFDSLDGAFCFFITGNFFSYQVTVTQDTTPIINDLVNNGDTICLFGLNDSQYGITVTSAEGCSTIVDIGGPASPLMIIDSNIENASCSGVNDGEISISVNGGTSGYSYSWSNGADSMNLVNIEEGTYTVTITDANGCTHVSQDFVVTGSSAIFPNFNITHVSCNQGNDGSITVSPSGGNGGPYTFLWSNNATSETINNLASNSYNVTITDSEDCSQIFSGFVNEPAAISGNKDVQAVRCFGESNGGITLSPSGGTPAYTYSWSNGTTGSLITNLIAGAYAYTIIDANGCTSTESINLVQPDQLAVNISVLSNVSCNSDSDGEIRINPTGGNGVPSALWNNGQIDYTISNLTVGDYSVTITDEKNCKAEAIATVEKEFDPAIISFDDLAIYGDGENTNLTYEANQTNVIFNWTIISSMNIASGFQMSGITPSTISSSFSLQSKRSPGMIIIEVFPENGNCIGDPVTTKITITPEKTPLFIPELFTPNDDGVNDCWEIVFPDPAASENYSVKIFNRSGGIVYERESLAQQWKGEECTDGAYYYIISDNTSGEIFKGAVTIIRK